MIGRITSVERADPHTFQASCDARHDFGYSDTVSLILTAFFVSFSVMGNELLSMRTAQLVFSSSFELFIVPLVTLGIGLGGASLYALRTRGRDTHVGASTMLVLYPLLTVAPYTIAHFFPFGGGLFFEELLYFLFNALAFVTAGYILSRLLLLRRNIMTLVYFFDLSGAAAGSAVILAVWNAFGYGDAITALFISAVVSAGFGVYITSRRRLAFLTLIAYLALGACMLSAGANLSVSCTPGTLYSKSDALAQIDVAPWSVLNPGKMRALTDLHVPNQVRNYVISVNCGYFQMPLISYDSLRDVSFLKESARAIPYELFPGKKVSVLVLGSGGGVDVLRARLSGLTHIDAVDINPRTVAAVNRFTTPQEIYALPVHVFIDDARRFIESATSSYDLIIDSHVARYGKMPLFADTPSYATTVEAYERYISHVSGRGVFMIVAGQDFQDQSLSTALLALARVGIAPSGHMVLLQDPNASEQLILIKPNGFTQTDRQLITLTALKRNLPPPSWPDSAGTEYSHTRPLTDEIPFVTQQNYLFAVFLYGKTATAVFVSLCITLFTILTLPFFMHRVRGAVVVAALSGYAICIGVGFIAFEIWAFQKLSLLIANPEYCLAILLGAILFFTGLGSLVTFPMSSYFCRLYGRISSALLMCILGLLVWNSGLFEHAFGLSFFARAVLCIVLLAPPSFFLGVFFPAGLRMAAALQAELIPWFWAVNGVAGVIGAMFARVIASSYGISAVMLYVMGAYLLAWMCLEYVFWYVAASKR